MKTQLERSENEFIKALYKNDIDNDESFLKIVFSGELFNNEAKENLLKQVNKKFLNDSIIIFVSKGYYWFGKIDKFFWLIDESYQIYLVSKNIIDIPIQITRLVSCWHPEAVDLQDFWADRQFQYHKESDVKDIYDSFVLLSKKYGYDFDLMKDIDDYEGIDEDIEEFNKLLTSYGIVNENK